jgi:hypothetical protein
MAIASHSILSNAKLLRFSRDLETSSGDELIDAPDEHNEFPPELGNIFGSGAHTSQPFLREPTQRLRAGQQRIALGSDPTVDLV